MNLVSWCVSYKKYHGFFIRKITNLYSALHAYSTLLDVEQLVVVANLDKINLNSSSFACSTTNSALNLPSTSKSTITPFQTVSPLSMNDMKLVNNAHRSTHQHDNDYRPDNNQTNKNHFTNSTNGHNLIDQLRFDPNNKMPLATDIPNHMNKSYDFYFSKLPIFC